MLSRLLLESTPGSIRNAATWQEVDRLIIGRRALEIIRVAPERKKRQANASYKLMSSVLFASDGVSMLKATCLKNMQPIGIPNFTTVSGAIARSRSRRF